MASQALDIRFITTFPMWTGEPFIFNNSDQVVFDRNPQDDTAKVSYVQEIANIPRLHRSGSSGSFGMATPLAMVSRS